MQKTEDLLPIIIKLEEETRVMEPQGKELADLTGEIVNYAHAYLNNINHINAYAGGMAEGEDLLGTPFSEDGRELRSLLKILKNDVDNPGINPASGGHLGYIPGGGIYPSAMGDYLAAVVNKYSGVFYASPGAVQLENMVIRWMAEILGFPKTAMGNLTSGGSIANLIAPM